MVELASGEFDRRKQNGIAYPGIAVVARLFGIKPTTLANFSRGLAFLLMRGCRAVRGSDTTVQA
jgi:hypothetical protein